MSTITPEDLIIQRTLIDAAVEHLPTAHKLGILVGPYATDDSDGIHLFAVPKGYQVEKIDTEKLNAGPRRFAGLARTDDLESFVAYTARHCTEATVLWIDLDPLTSKLQLRAVIDDHANHMPGWRGHAVTYAPRPSVEWTKWLGANGKVFGQAEFAAWMEDQLADIATVDGLPSGADMLTMLLDFEAKQDMRVKSSVRLQSGGVQLEYVDTDDAATISRMKVFDRFAIGIPAFWGGQRYRIDARLRYRTGEGKVKFWYELIRPDRVLDAAAHDVITKLHDQLDEESITAPVLMGAL
jgi:uncharacterized protein YfdQ (DUF2303 family)